MDWNILGHEWAVQLLANHIAHNEIRHAYLFTGPAGVGRRTLALRFAQAINCKNPPAPGYFCGNCRTCTQIERQQQADLTIIQAETEGGTLKVDQVRDLQRALSLAPYESRFRIALLLRFQEANPSAQNALLKTLEEAPEKAILLLTADSAESVLPTIASRCELMRLRPMSLQRVEEELQTRWNAQPGESKKIAHLSGGRVGYAFRLSQDSSLVDQQLRWIEDLEGLLTASRRERFAAAERMAKDKETLRQVLLTWLAYWRDVMLTASGAQVPLTFLAWEDLSRNLACKTGLAGATRRVNILEQALQRLDNNINARLLLEVVLLDLSPDP